MIPAMVEIARDVQKLAPKATFINYGNPMSPVCRAIRKATGANVIGLCHGVPDCARELARVLGVGRLQYTAAGINHLTWFTDVRDPAGGDLMPKLRQIACEKSAVMPRPEAFGLETWLGDTVTVPQEMPFTWRLTDRFGAYPVPGDRHVTEFFGRMFSGKGAFFGKTLGVDAYSFEGTIRSGDRWYAEMTRLALSPEALKADFLGRGGGEHEQAVEIIASLRQNLGRQYSANLPNAGQVPNLPADAVIECPAVADGMGMRPMMLPPMPSGIVGTLATRFAWVETIVEAALEGSRAKFVQALLLDGAVDSVETAGRLADDLLAAQKAYLPQFGG
jgi:alpha-galactosidase